MIMCFATVYGLVVHLHTLLFILLPFTFFQKRISPLGTEELKRQQANLQSTVVATKLLSYPMVGVAASEHIYVLS